MENILILAPHQDDEILSCSYVIKKALEKGDNVLIAFITNGDYEGKALADIRATESKHALVSLGIDKNNIFFFGYGDDTINDLYNAPGNALIASKCSKFTYAPSGCQSFHKIHYGCETLYTKNSLLCDIIDFLRIYLPNQIYCPSKYDVHGDHNGTFLFLEQALDTMKSSTYHPQIYTYLIHILNNFAYWPNRLGNKIIKPIGIRMKKSIWNKRIIIKGNKELVDKRKLISIFKSQKPSASYGFLYSFAKEEEIFWIGDC